MLPCKVQTLIAWQQSREEGHGCCSRDDVENGVFCLGISSGCSPLLWLWWGSRPWTVYVRETNAQTLFAVRANLGQGFGDDSDVGFEWLELLLAVNWGVLGLSNGGARQAGNLVCIDRQVFSLFALLLGVGQHTSNVLCLWFLPLTEWNLYAHPLASSLVGVRYVLHLLNRMCVSTYRYFVKELLRLSSRDTTASGTEFLVEGVPFMDWVVCRWLQVGTRFGLVASSNLRLVSAFFFRCLEVSMCLWSLTQWLYSCLDLVGSWMSF